MKFVKNLICSLGLAASSLAMAGGEPPSCVAIDPDQDGYLINAFDPNVVYTYHREPDGKILDYYRVTKIQYKDGVQFLLLVNAWNGNPEYWIEHKLVSYKKENDCKRYVKSQSKKFGKRNYQYIDSRDNGWYQ